MRYLEMFNKEKNFVSAVIYVYKAEDRIEEFLRTVIRIFEKHFENSEIICVDDCSTDKSIDIIKKIGQEPSTFTNITIVNLSYYHGLERAMNAGVELAIGDFVFEFDSTILDFDPEEIMTVYWHSLKGYDIVSASPDKKQKIMSNIFYKLFEYFTDSSYKMGTERFRILSRRVINRIGSMNKTIPYRKAVYANCGLKTDNLRYHIVCMEKRDGVVDKKEKKYRFSLAVDSLILFTNLGYRFAIAMTFLMIFIVMCVAIYSITIYLLGNPVAGWTTTILFLSFCFFGLFGILTIIIKYLQILVNLVFKRKRYSFESIEKITKG